MFPAGPEPALGPDVESGELVSRQIHRLGQGSQFITFAGIDGGLLPMSSNAEGRSFGGEENPLSWNNGRRWSFRCRLEKIAEGAALFLVLLVRQ